MKRGQNVGKMEGRTNKCVGLVAPCRAGVEGGVWLVPVPNGGCRSEARRGMLSESRETAVGGWV